MKVRVMSWLVLSVCLWFTPIAFAGDRDCYGYTSTTSHFLCGVHGNCTWWAASMRPDLAAAITGSGWNGGQWYDQFRNKGFPVGSVPKPGSVVEFSSPAHVAYIEKVNSDNSFDVTEMNWYDEPNDGFVEGVNYATYHPNSNGTYHRNNGTQAWTLKGFIYPKGISSETDNTCDYGKEKCDIRVQGDVGWFPAVTTCQNALQWFIVSTDREGNQYPIGSRPNSAACSIAACTPN